MHIVSKTGHNFFTWSKFCHFFWNFLIKTDLWLLRQFSTLVIIFNLFWTWPVPYGPPVAPKSQQNLSKTLGDSGKILLTLANSDRLWMTFDGSGWLWLSARVSQNQPESSKVIQSRSELVRVSQILPESARVLDRLGALADFLARIAGCSF